ncbi:MAG TPA: hypothetical protein VEI83_09640 [Acidimicrobiales bacterium]|nr:hypothetical protein [Acidimicrobiales bacterium]
MARGRTSHGNFVRTPEVPTLSVLTASVVPNLAAPFAFEVVLEVDGHPLQELLRGVDEPEAWVGPPFEIIKSPSRHLIGGGNEWGGDGFPEGKVALLACSCGDPQCGALLATITVMADVVTWSDIECFGRPKADLSAIPGFSFRSMDYFAKLGDLSLPEAATGGIHARHRLGAHQEGHPIRP